MLLSLSMLMFKKRNANFFHFASFSRGGQQCSHMAFITLLKYFKWIKKVRLGAKLFIIIFILTNRFVEMDCYASLPEP